MVEKHASEGLTSVTRLLEQYETHSKVRSSEHFSSSAVSASRLADRINLSRTSKTVQITIETKRVVALATGAGPSPGQVAKKEADEEVRLGESAFTDIETPLLPASPQFLKL